MDLFENGFAEPTDIAHELHRSFGNRLLAPFAFGEPERHFLPHLAIGLRTQSLVNRAIGGHALAQRYVVQKFEIRVIGHVRDHGIEHVADEDVPVARRPEGLCNGFDAAL